MKKKLLIVEDDPGLQSQMRWCFGDDVEVNVADSKKSVVAMLEEHKPQVVTLDLGLPPDAGGTSQGFEILRYLASNHPTSKVIVITGREENEHAVTAISLGAYDFYQKPIDSPTLQFVVERAFKLCQLEEQYKTLQKSADNEAPLPGLIANSQAMLTLVTKVKKIAPTEATVVITGETGTGKEIIAHSIHRLSSRAEGPMIAINCAAIPENLLESELFGHEKGSFTGAHARKIGKVEAANGGTLFLDEIGDMPQPLQAKILRFLQERSFERVGSNTSMTTDVRVVSATHRDLRAMIDDGSFREDLFYRIGEITLDVPALRERGTDVLLIANHLLHKYRDDNRLRFSEDAIAAMEACNWSGNVRELENRVRRGAILCEADVVTAADLELSESSSSEALQPLKQVRAHAESKAINRALVTTNGNLSETARLLEVSRPTLYSLIEKYGISHNNGE